MIDDLSAHRDLSSLGWARQVLSDVNAQLQTLKYSSSERQKKIRLDRLREAALRRAHSVFCSFCFRITGQIFMRVLEGFSRE